MNTLSCSICGRTLTAPESARAGIGPQCAARYAVGASSCGLSIERIEQLAGLGDAGVNRWLHLFRRAIGAGRMRDARQFIEAAERVVAASLAAASLPLAA